MRRPLPLLRFTSSFWHVAIPALSMRLGLPDGTQEPTDSMQYIAYTTLGEKYPQSELAAGAQYKRAWSLLELQKADEATAAFRQCLATNPRPDVRPIIEEEA